MIFEKTRVYNFEGAIRGMRNPLNSWDKSDSDYCVRVENMDCNECPIKKACDKAGFRQEDFEGYIIGEADMDLCQRLIKSGSEHRKFLRQIGVSVDITAPFYWWKEADTYKVGTVADSCSTMHRIHSKMIEENDFTIDDVLVDDDEVSGICLNLSDMFAHIISCCEALRNKYLETKDKAYWRALIQLLPMAYNQKRTVTLNYEVIRSMYHQRKDHKLTEWSRDFVEWVLTLPYAKELIMI